MAPTKRKSGKEKHLADDMVYKAANLGLLSDIETRKETNRLLAVHGRLTPALKRIILEIGGNLYKLKEDAFFKGNTNKLIGKKLIRLENGRWVTTRDGHLLFRYFKSLKHATG